MNVYLVTRCYTEPEVIIEAAFSTLEKAEAFIAVRGVSDRWPSWDVMVEEIDPALPGPSKAHDDG